MTISPQKLASLAIEWSEWAGETVAVEQIKAAVYAYGSELGVRRLAHKYRSFEVSYSENMKTWYFSLELKHG